jgi:hypothetical protein
MAVFSIDGLIGGITSEIAADAKRVRTKGLSNKVLFFAQITGRFEGKKKPVDQGEGRV